MTDGSAPARNFRGRRWLIPALLAVPLVLGLWWRGRGDGGETMGERGRTRVTQDLVVERVQAVAKLVSSETTVRDVVIYENTWLNSTKRSLVVVTGKVSAGIDLSSGTDVRIDDGAKRITVTLPPAGILGVEVMSLRTYDERAGLWNPFRPSDRDAIYQRVRAQLQHAGEELGVVEHANRSAKAMLETLLAQDGYAVDVIIRARPLTRPGG